MLDSIAGVDRIDESRCLAERTSMRSYRLNPDAEWSACVRTKGFGDLASQRAHRVPTAT